MPPKWLTVEMAANLHGLSIARYGGEPGLRDHGLLESALSRPRNLHAYENDVPLYALAAACCSGVVRNHPFVDGNKRAGFLAAGAFLGLNRYRLTPNEAEVVHVILALAAGKLDETALAQWIADNTTADDETDGGTPG